MRVGIIGAGLAGCALAYVLKNGGAEPVIYDAAETIAAGASGNEVGLYNPRFFAERNPESDFYTAAYALAVRSFANWQDIGWRQCGALHLVTDEQKRARFRKMVKTSKWEPEHMRLVNADEASDIAGVGLSYEALYLPDSGCVSPKKLCEFYTRGVEVHLGHTVDGLDDLDVDLVVLACGHAAKQFVNSLPLSPVRGQISYVSGSPALQHLNCVVCYGGYVTPANEDGVHALGSTFERGVDISAETDEDDRDNIEKLAAVSSDFTGGLEVQGRRAAVRTAVKGHFPVIGKLPLSGGVYVSVGHGSHGILSSLMGAYLLGDMILGQPLSLPRDVVSALSPSRFG